MTSLSEMQTKGLKGHFAEESWKALMEKTGQNVEPVPVIEETEGSKPKKVKLRIAKTQKSEDLSVKDDPNVLGFSQSSSESSDDEEEEKAENELKEDEPEPDETDNKTA